MSDLARKRSEIWKHFCIVNKDKAKCEYCSKIISYSGGGTGNLNRHMKKMHGTVSIQQTLIHCINPQIAASLQTRTESNSAETGGSVVPSTSDVAPTQRQTTQYSVQTRIDNFAKSNRPLPVSKTKQLDEQIVKFIVKGFHAFAIVEEPEFINMFKMMLPTYSLPSRKTISSSLIPKLYQLTKEKIIQLTAEADAICLTTDGWTSINNISFIALTAHFLNQKSSLESVLLGCTQFNERHTADNLSNFLLQEVSNWGVSNKIAGIVTDNAANIVAAVRLTTWRHFPCFAHTVNLVVQHSLDTIKDQLDKIKTIVQYFKHSPSAANRLQAMQIQMELPPLKLKQSVITRWNSTYDMLNRILKIKDAVISTLAIEQPRLNTLMPDEWILLEKIVAVLKIFYDVTVEISAEKSVSISKVIVLVKIMKTCVEKHLVGNGPEPYLRFLTTLRNQLNDRFYDIESHPLTAEASLLDPRFKRHAFVSKEKYEQCLKSIKTKLRTLLAQTTSFSELPPPQQSQQPTSSLWDEFDSEVENQIVRNPTAASIVEIDKYLNEPLIKRSDDPLVWWHSRRLLYPNLYTLMKRRLCIPATSVPCERIFSKAGMTINQKRSSLKPDKASQVLFLNYNL